MLFGNPIGCKKHFWNIENVSVKYIICLDVQKIQTLFFGVKNMGFPNTSDNFQTFSIRFFGEIPKLGIPTSYKPNKKKKIPKSVKVGTYCTCISFNIFYAIHYIKQVKILILAKKENVFLTFHTIKSNDLRIELINLCPLIT